jgi:hypothetical protein
MYAVQCISLIDIGKTLNRVFLFSSLFETISISWITSVTVKVNVFRMLCLPPLPLSFCSNSRLYALVRKKVAYILAYYFISCEYSGVMDTSKISLRFPF